MIINQHKPKVSFVDLSRNDTISNIKSETFTLEDL
jgi:hypothetical protein